MVESLYLILEFKSLTMAPYDILSRHSGCLDAVIQNQKIVLDWIQIFEMQVYTLFHLKPI